MLLESVGRALVANEPVLLVGETGVGKTSLVQFLATQTKRRLRVINMNQQSDSADLLGGFRPVSLDHSLHGLREAFLMVFHNTFNSADNTKFLGHLDSCYRNKRWEPALTLMRHTVQAGIEKCSSELPGLTSQWREMRTKLRTAEDLVKRKDLATAFAFIEGTLTEAVKCGDWILLDEVS